jgi:hypothetical protein
MAALGIDSQRQPYYEPARYTSHLSALVKLSQILVVQHAVDLADGQELKHPGDAIDEMRKRFLVYGVHAPFG